MKRFVIRYFFVSKDSPDNTYCLKKVEYALSESKALLQFTLIHYPDLQEIEDTFLNWTATQENA